METNSMQAEEATQTHILSPEQLLAHWQGHRKLTRRVIEAFPDDALFSYSVGGMRPFSELALEMIGMGGEGIGGIATGNWEAFPTPNTPTTKAELLKLWDEVTETINKTWPQISLQRFQETDVAFGQYESKIYWTLFYFIDNEIHHRGQGYVYLRSLGIQPPPFWERE
ncbi:damage-inducible protein DinB [Rhodocytophaga rosea]|uniref:Damage-inducible protein DinB n=1 Tax=Rhodocytophaga rosea TaxID=2704465 RepID=A0A6C0GDZ8_9BACT|nr:DinB family protein [Rhodocytophaga rosea]QHT65982.1 damage-inducible protein DinB [Rhodocytophaga rosea]